MYRDIATKWTAALRSGDYTQGKGALHRNGAFCCLGVLCDLHRQEVGGEWCQYQSPEVTVPQGTLTYMAPGGDWDYALLPDEVAVWAGLRGTRPSADSEPLTVRNDEGMAFDQLADLIDTRWETL